MTPTRGTHGNFVINIHVGERSNELFLNSFIDSDALEKTVVKAIK